MDNPKTIWSEADVDRLLSDFLPAEMPAALREHADEPAGVVPSEKQTSNTLPFGVWPAAVTAVLSLGLLMMVFIGGDEPGVRIGPEPVTKAPRTEPPKEAEGNGVKYVSGAVEAQAYRFSYTATEPMQERKVVRTSRGTAVEVRESTVKEELKVVDQKTGKQIDFEGMQLDIEIFDPAPEPPEQPKP